MGVYFLIPPSRCLFQVEKKFMQKPKMQYFVFSNLTYETPSENEKFFNVFQHKLWPIRLIFNSTLILYIPSSDASKIYTFSNG